MKHEKIVSDRKKAFDLLEAKGLSLREIFSVKGLLEVAYIDDHPNIAIKLNKGEVEYYHSTINMINHLAFETEKEVIMANAIYENMNEITSIDEFIQLLKFTFRIIGVDSRWV